MDFIASPLVTVILNVIASFLVSKGILDSKSSMVFVQLANNFLAGIVTITVSIYSIFKIVELHKHKITVTTTTPSNTLNTQPTVTTTTTTDNSVKTPISQGVQTPPSSQTGLPKN